MQVVQGDQAQSENFFCFDQMTDVTARKLLAGRAGAALFDRIFVARELGVLQIERARGGESGAIARQPGRQARNRTCPFRARSARAIAAACPVPSRSAVCFPAKMARSIPPPASFPPPVRPR